MTAPNELIAIQADLIELRGLDLVPAKLAPVANSVPS